MPMNKRELLVLRNDLVAFKLFHNNITVLEKLEIESVINMIDKKLKLVNWN